MNTIRNTVLAVLDKMDEYLKTEPARLIGYGAAFVIFLVVQVVGHFKPGVLPKVSFDDAVGMSFAAITTLVILVESIRRAVYSPQTYIEDLSDEAEAAHEAAHLEESIQRAIEARQAAKAQVAQTPDPLVSVQSDKVQ